MTTRYPFFTAAMPNDALQELVPRIMEAALSFGGERETQQRVFACIVAACTFIAAIDDDNTRNGLIGELRGFVEDGIKLARTTRVMAEQGMSYEDARDAAVAAGIEVWPPDDTTH